MNPSRVPTRRLISLLLFSCAAMLLEITLTRLFAVLFYPPYVFAILSLAVLGIGMGAACISARKDLRREDRLPLYIVLTGVSALVIVVVVALGGALQWQAILFILVALPYFFSGLTLATLFSLTATQSTQLYMAELIGAGSGVLLAVPIMNAVGPINSTLVTVVLFGLAALGIRPAPRWYGLAGFALIAVVILVTNLGSPWLNVDPAALPSDKPLKADLAAKGRLDKTIWDSFARTDLVKPAPNTPHRIYLDGAAGSVMPSTTNTEPLLRDIGFFPFATEQPKRVLVIGPGGGLDVWFGLQSKASEIVAVEVNPASVALVREYGDLNGHLYDQPSVRVVVDEGRSFLRRDDSLYDLIFLSQVVTLSSERTGYALTENTIYTVEAFRDYLRHLTPNGQVALKLYDESTLTRALSAVLEGYRRDGVSDADAMTHVAALLDARVQPPIPLLIVRNKPFTRDDMLVYGAIAREIGLAPLYMPFVFVRPPLDAVARGTRPFAAIVSESESDISPPTDDRPFFFQFDRGVPKNLIPLIAAVLSAAVIGAVLVVFSVRRIKPRRRRWSPVYFASLGAGYMVIEIALVQQTRLFLGHPTFAITTVLAALLIGSGLGSWLAGLRVLKKVTTTPILPALAVAVAVLLWIVIWPVYSQTFTASAAPVRLLAVAVLVLPLAVVMGMPFPLGLRLVGTTSDKLVALGWAVNGVATVIGSVGAVTLAILFGFQSVLVVGLCAYLIAAAAAYLGVLHA